MREPEKVVAAVDGTEIAAAVLASARVLADRIGAVIRVVHVGTSTPQLRELVRGHGLEVEDVEGTVVPELLRALARDDVTLGVVGTRATASGPTPAGSTALAVLRAATKPVLLVPPSATTPGLAALGRVAVPLDGTPEVSAALQEVLALLLKGGTDVLVVHVFDRARAPVFWDRPARDARIWASEFLARHCDQPAARAVLVTGDPGAAALDESASGRADVVLMAWRQDDAAGRALTLKHVLSGATVPVLVVPVRGRAR